MWGKNIRGRFISCLKYIYKKLKIEQVNLIQFRNGLYIRRVIQLLNKCPKFYILDDKPTNLGWYYIQVTSHSSKIYNYY